MLDELYQHFHVFSAVRLGFQFFQSLRRVELRGQQDFVSMVNLADPFLAETAALKSYRIQPVRLGIAGGRGFRKWKNIAGNGCPATDKRVRANANKMVHGAERTDLSPLLDRDVAAKSRRIGQND